MRILVFCALLTLFPGHLPNMCDTEIDYVHFMVPNQFLDGEQFWTSKTKDVVECAVMCLRRKICFSFNFDTNEGVCELNVNASTALQTKAGMFFSQISSWPSQIDPDCYNRPCGEDETCIPSNIVAGTSCSYSCIKLYRRCPLPDGIKSNHSRTIGSLFSFTCDNGFVGGDTAVCLPTGRWNVTMDTMCTPIYGSECLDDEVCRTINGFCSSESKCTCPSTHVYNNSEMRCFKECDDSWLLFDDSCYFFGNISFSSNFAEAETFCLDQNASLLEVNTVDELDFLQTEMMTNHPIVTAFWSDLYQFGDEDGTERWKNSNNSLDPQDWYDGEPNFPSERCTVFHSPLYRFLDLSCEGTIPVPACEK